MFPKITECTQCYIDIRKTVSVDGVKPWECLCGAPTMLTRDRRTREDGGGGPRRDSGRRDSVSKCATQSISEDRAFGVDRAVEYSHASHDNCAR